MQKHWYLQRFWTMIVAKNCDFWSVFLQISCGRYPPNSSKFPKPHFLLTCTYLRGRRHGRNLPMAKATDGLAFGTTRHCRIKGYRPCRRPRNSDRRYGKTCPKTEWVVKWRTRRMEIASETARDGEVAKRQAVETASAKQGNLSKTQAQGVVNSSPDGLPKHHLGNR